MPKCLECGFEASRLQWTHFRYKCTGRFKNSKEYKQTYPNAQLVDKNLAEKTAITLPNFIKKYGHLEGTKRWESYKEKQAHTNTYEYKKDRYNWTREDFENYNKKRACTLSNMIERYGEKEGALRWQQYCERQAYTNTLAYFQERYGEIEGRTRYEEINELKGAAGIQNGLGSSNVERLFVIDLQGALEEKIDYSLFSKQFCVHDNQGRAHLYDIVHKGRAIEFHGDYWHCNPSLYDKNFYHIQKQTIAKDIWDKDQIKTDLLQEKRGIPTLVIWESEYVNSPKNVIERCVEWILNGKELPK